MRQQAEDAWARAREFLADDHPFLHRLLLMAWSPMAVVAIGWLVVRVSLDPDRPIWASPGPAQLSLCIWLMLVAIFAYAGAAAQFALVKELAPEGHQEAPVRAYFLFSGAWAASLVGVGLTVTRGAPPRWPLALCEFLVGLWLGALFDEILVPRLASQGTVAFVGLGREIGQAPGRWVRYCLGRTALGLVALALSGLFLAMPVWLLAAVWVALSLTVATALMAQAGHWVACLGFLAALVVVAGIEIALVRRWRGRVRCAGQALVACFRTAVSGYRIVLLSLLAGVAVGFLLQSVGVSLSFLYVLLDVYLDLLLVVFFGRLILAAFTPALIGLRFFSLAR